ARENKHPRFAEARSTSTTTPIGLPWGAPPMVGALYPSNPKPWCHARHVCVSLLAGLPTPPASEFGKGG
ncbi:unnamed protein product, partial [Ectocarpus sp. 12 AP-2014]